MGGSWEIAGEWGGGLHYFSGNGGHIPLEETGYCSLEGTDELNIEQKCEVGLGEPILH